jgi:hypothetical protein
MFLISEYVASPLPPPKEGEFEVPNFGFKVQRYKDLKI